MLLNKRKRGWLRGLALIALLMSIAYPAGYMPGDITQGEWIVVCPDGLPDGFWPDNHGDHQDHGDDDTDHQDSNSTYCALGSHLSPKSLALPALEFACLVAQHLYQQFAEQIVVIRLIRAYQTRGPPELVPA